MLTKPSHIKNIVLNVLAYISLFCYYRSTSAVVMMLKFWEIKHLKYLKSVYTIGRTLWVVNHWPHPMGCTPMTTPYGLYTDDHTLWDVHHWPHLMGCTPLTAPNGMYSLFKILWKLLKICQHATFHVCLTFYSLFCCNKTVKNYPEMARTKARICWS